MSTLLGRYIVKKIVDLGYDKDFLHPPCDENDETVTLICDSLEAVSGEELTKMAATVNLDDNCNPDYKSALDIVFWTQVSWEKLVSAAVCTYRLCMKALLRGEHQLANSFIYWFDHYVRTYRIQNWVDNQGGWVSIPNTTVLSAQIYLSHCCNYTV